MNRSLNRTFADFLRQLVGVALLVLFSHSSWGGLIWDANKPWPISTDPLDNSCWMATGANMMAADGWGNSQDIYNYMRQNYTEPPNNQVWMWTQLGSPDMAFGWIYDNPFTFSVDTDDILLQSTPNFAGGRPLNTSRKVIDDIFALGSGDPVGLQLIWPDNGGAHYVTAWSDGLDGLVVTDSDDGDASGPFNGPVTLAWNGNDVLMYGSLAAEVGYLFYLSEVPEPGTLALILVGMFLLSITMALQLRPPKLRKPIASA